MNISGKIKEIYEVKQISDKFRKREFVVEYTENEQYPQFIKFELTQNNCDLINRFSKGDFINVHFDLRGKPWTNKNGETTYFTSLTAWKLEKADSQANTNEGFTPDNTENNNDDLPF